MKMSKGARQVMEACDFPEIELHSVELWVQRNRPAYIIKKVKETDPLGECDQVEEFVTLPNPYSADVWHLYDYLMQWLEDDFWHEDFQLIAEMSTDIERVKAAMSRSKPHLKYLYKIWADVKPAPETNTIDPTIEKHKVKTSDL